MRKNIPLAKVIPNPDQPRKHFDQKALGELAASILARGLMQPITVRPLEDGTFMIVGGERRWRAHCLLAERGDLGKAPTIKANVEKIDDEEMRLQAIIENLQREDIKPLEEARAYQAMLDRGWTVPDLAKALGISQPFRISERTNLLRLDPSIQTLIDGGNFSLGAAFYMHDLPHHDQLAILREWNAGRIKTLEGVKAAAQAIRDRYAQPEMFGEGDGVKPEPSAEDKAALDRMTKMVEKMVQVIGTGWKDGEFTAIKTVDPNRAGSLADQLEQIGKSVRHMAGALRSAEARATIL